MEGTQSLPFLAIVLPMQYIISLYRRVLYTFVNNVVWILIFVADQRVSVRYAQHNCETAVTVSSLFQFKQIM